MALAAFAVIAVAQIIPASAGSVTIEHASCPYYDAHGQSYRESTYTYGQTTVQQSCGWLGVQAWFYDPVLGDYYTSGWVQGNYTVRYDSIGIVTPVYSHHKYGPNSGNYNVRTSYG